MCIKHKYKSTKNKSNIVNWEVNIVGHKRGVKHWETKSLNNTYRQLLWLESFGRVGRIYTLTPFFTIHISSF